MQNSRRFNIFIIVFFFFLSGSSAVVAELQQTSLPSDQEIGIIEHLGEFVPLDLSFIDSKGDTVFLRDYIDKPVVVSLVYLNCPGICSPLLGGMADVLDRMDLKPGEDYKALTISFDPSDTPELAREKKRNYFESFRFGPFPEEQWKWVTGDSVSIHKFTDAVGFKYKREGKDFIHAGALIVLSADGKISRYLRGIEFQPFDLKMAITEAAEGRVGPTISKVLLYCFSYDPEGKRYVFNFMKVFGTVFLVFLAGFAIFLIYQTKYRRKKERN
ncbi:MAG: SCO family protein [Calditrichaeota bacterium]|nr:SCO family protein [Calditrichota bacterium]RQV98838.1 MAG: SCO family protein [Calditrichota bacterium]